jgi:hypothetical protein
MLISLLVLLGIVGAVLGVTRACSFSPGGPTVDPNSAPTVDAGAELRAAARALDFDLREPTLPAGWRANSSGTGPVGSGAGASVSVRIGLLTPAGTFLQVSQSGAAAADLVAADTGEAGAAGGTTSAGGAEWTTYPGRRGEVAWVTSLGGTTTLLTGTAGELEFAQLAAAMVAAPVLPRPTG